MMSVHDAYEHFQTPQNLREHLLRVASFADILLDAWTGAALDRQAIIIACALHDIAKPIQFNLDKQEQFGLSEEESIKLMHLQNEMKDAYGLDEHRATLAMCREIGCNEKVLQLIDDLEWYNVPKLLEQNATSSLIPIYCDMRIGLNGIAPLAVRLAEIAERSKTFIEANQGYKENGYALEKEISKGVSLDVNTISDKQINEQFAKIQQLLI